MTVVNSSNTGIKQLVYAIMTDEVLETYATIKDAPPMINIKISPKSDTANLWADGRVVETATTMGDIDVEVELQDVPLEVQADWLGHVLDVVKGTLTYNINDQSPYIALGYERTKGNGKSRFVWLYKLKFQDIDEEGKTQDGKITFQTPKIKGLAVANKSGDWKNIADENTKGSEITDFLATVGGKTI